MPIVMITAGRRHRRGQSLTEFALVVPVLFLLIFGVLDGSLLMFSVGTARYAAGEGSRQAAALGNAANADSKIVGAIRATVSSTSLFQVDEIDIYKLNQDGNGNRTPMINPEPWPSPSRNVGNGTSDFMGVTVNYTYNWKAGFFSPLGPVKTNATVYIRLEPQSY